MIKEIVQTIIIFVTTGIIGKKIIERKTIRGISKEIIQKQLDIVYTPIIKFIEISNETFELEKVNYIYKIFQENINIVPHKMYELCKNLKEKQEYSQFKILKEMIDDNYDWCLKSLRYPCRKRRINDLYLPNAIPYNIYSFIVPAAAITIPIISFFHMPQEGKHMYALMITIMTISLISVACSITFLIDKYTPLFDWLEKALSKKFSLFLIIGSMVILAISILFS